MRMTGEAARAWGSFVAQMRQAAPADVDADDLAESLDAHLESRTEGSDEVDAAAMERIIGEIRADLLEEFGSEAAPAPAAAPDPDWWLLALFLGSLGALPFIGPLPLLASWILSRWRMSRAHHAIDTLPSIVGATALLAGIPFGLGYLVTTIFAELVRAPVAAYAAVEAALTLALLALPVVLRIRRPGWFRTVFAPLDSAIGERSARRLAIILAALSVTAAAAAAVIVGLRS